VLVRDARRADLDVLLRINEANVPAVGAADRVSMDSLLVWSCTSLVAEVEGRIAGFCIVLPEGTAYGSPNYRYFADRLGEFRYVDRIAMDDGQRGRGIGAALYREVSARHPVQPLVLEVNVVPPNEGSMRFHLREGFRELDRLETRPGNVVSLMIRDPAAPRRNYPSSQ
jgi:predicted GNAT superfamily acetyltransferase